MKKTTLYFDSRDGETKVYAVRYEPEESALVDGKPRAILQIVHGMAEYVERYEEFAEYFTAKGFVVTGDDHLGHGKTVPEGGVYGYFCKQDPATVVVRDVHRLKKMTQSLYPGVPYFILGHSMGSFILRNYIMRYGTGIQGAIIMGTGMPSRTLVNAALAVVTVKKCLMGSRHKCEWMSRRLFGGYNKLFGAVKTPNDWLSRREENVAVYEADTLCGFHFTANGFETLFTLIKRGTDPKNMCKIPSGLPILLQSGDKDAVGQFGKGVRKTADALLQAGVKDVELHLYPEDRHEILQEEDRELVMTDLYDWIQSRLPGGVG